MRSTHDAEDRISTVSESWSELDSRTSDGLQVSLLWCAATDEVRVVVSDARAGESFVFQVVPSEALAAFHHPFSYVPDHGHRGSAGTPVTTQANQPTTGARHASR